MHKKGGKMFIVKMAMNGHELIGKKVSDKREYNQLEVVEYVKKYVGTTANDIHEIIETAKNMVSFITFRVEWNDYKIHINNKKEIYKIDISIVTKGCENI